MSLACCVKTHIVNASITPVAKAKEQFHLLYEHMLAYMTRKVDEMIFPLRKPRGLYWENKTEAKKVHRMELSSYPFTFDRFP